MSTHYSSTDIPRQGIVPRMKHAEARQDVVIPAAANKVDHAKRLRRVQKFSRWLDNSLRVPGTSIRFGLDSLIGLIPGIGDSLTAIASGWVLHQAYRTGVSKRTLARMAGNVAIDLVSGVVPIIGDVFDVYWKSNVRNARLLEDHLVSKAAEHSARTRERTD